MEIRKLSRVESDNHIKIYGLETAINAPSEVVVIFSFFSTVNQIYTLSFRQFRKMLRDGWNFMK